MTECDRCKQRLCDTGAPCPSAEEAKPGARRASPGQPDGLATLMETPANHHANLIKTKLEMSGIPCVVSTGLVGMHCVDEWEPLWTSSRVLVPEMMLSQAQSVLRSEVMLV